MSKRKLKYPDDLVSLWNYMHRSDEAISDKEAGCIWNELQGVLHGALFNLDLPGIGMCDAEIDDAADDFINHLFSAAVCPGHISSSSLLVRAMKKYLAQTRNPVQYEMNQILHEALLRVEKRGLIKRDAQGTIGAQTKFVLVDIASPGIAEIADYEAHRGSVPFFGSRTWGGALERTRMIKPTDADELVEKLLRAFGGWTRTMDLLRVMKNHIPEQLVVTAGTAVDDDGEEISHEPVAPGAEGYINDLDSRQIFYLSRGVAERIWKRVQKISDGTFCIYWLPKTTGSGQKIPMRELGPTSTVNDQNKRIDAVFRDEVQKWLSDSPAHASAREERAARRGMGKILELLRQCCTEKGYSMSL